MPYMTSFTPATDAVERIKQLTDALFLANEHALALTDECERRAQECGSLRRELLAAQRRLLATQEALRRGGLTNP